MQTVLEAVLALLFVALSIAVPVLLLVRFVPGLRRTVGSGKDKRQSRPRKGKTLVPAVNSKVRHRI